MKRCQANSPYNTRLLLTGHASGASSFGSRRQQLTCPAAETQTVRQRRAQWSVNYEMRLNSMSAKRGKTNDL